MTSKEEVFTRELLKQKRENKKKYNLLPKEEYNELLENVRHAYNTTTTKTSREYYRLSKFEILKCGPVERLIKRRKTPQDKISYYVTLEETFDIIREAHIATGHGGRDRMLKRIKLKYANISIESLELFKSFCDECQKKKKRPSGGKGVVVRPLLSRDFASRGQVDLIDMRATEYNDYNWIMVYQDHLTKFCVVRPIKRKRASEVTSQLMDIFLLLGAPAILQSDNGLEFTAQIISKLKECWPDLRLVHGKPRYPQSQGSVERANSDIKDMLAAWLESNDTKDWVTGIKFVQFQKNSAHHSGIKRSPYSALFGCEARIGLTSSSLPREILERLETEEDLEIALGRSPREEEEPREEEPETRKENEEEIALRTTRIKRQRTEAYENQLSQAERMVKRSRLKLKPLDVGDTVIIPVPLVDRGRNDPRNLLGVVLAKDPEKDTYQIGVKSGVLNVWFARNQFDSCRQKLVSLADVNQGKSLSVRAAVASETGGGQGFVKCVCSSSRRCHSGHCKCVRNNQKCTPKCHSKGPCSNK